MLNHPERALQEEKKLYNLQGIWFIDFLKQKTIMILHNLAILGKLSTVEHIVDFLSKKVILSTTLATLFK